MIFYIFKKTLKALPVFFGVSLLLFILFHVAGGDPVYQILGRHASLEEVSSLRHTLGLDQSYSVQFLSFIKQMITLDFGRSYFTQEKIIKIISSHTSPTFMLMVPSYVLTTFFSLSFCLSLAYAKERWPHHTLIHRLGQGLIFMSIVGMCIPLLAYILFGQYVLAYLFNLFPISGYEAQWPDCLQSVALPVLLFVCVNLGFNIRFYQVALSQELSQAYIQTARAKGLSEFSIFFKHVLKNMMVPIITHSVLEIPLLLLGSFLLENFFNIPGIGSLMVDAVHNSDFPLIQAMTLLTAFLFMIGTLVTDFCYVLIDPRMRPK